MHIIGFDIRIPVVIVLIYSTIKSYVRKVSCVHDRYNVSKYYITDILKNLLASLSIERIATFLATTQSYGE